MLVIQTRSWWHTYVIENADLKVCLGIEFWSEENIKWNTNKKWKRVKTKEKISFQSYGRSNLKISDFIGKFCIGHKWSLIFQFLSLNLWAISKRLAQEGVTEKFPTAMNSDIDGNSVFNREITWRGRH